MSAQNSSLSPSALVAVIGAGTMGAGIAQVAAAAGHPVILYDQNAEVTEYAIKRIGENLQKDASRGRITKAQAAATVARIRPCTALQDLHDCALAIEAVAEDLSIKRDLFCALESVCPRAILASNTSSLSITALAAKLRAPGKLVGMHFFNPAPRMKLVEVISGLATDQAIAECIAATAAAWGKTALPANNAPGFIANRIARAFYAEPLQLLQHGAADIATMDALFRAAGFPLGPFELMDFIGNDVNHKVTESVFSGFYQATRFRPSLLQKELVDAGRYGRKSGRGWYDYAAEDRPQAATVTSDFRPTEVRVVGDLGPAAGLIKAAQRAGIAVKRTNEGEAAIVIGDSRLALTDGRSATRRAIESGHDGWLAFDLPGDGRIAIAKAERADARDVQHAVGFFNALGFAVSVLDDAPGLCIMRTVCMLANEAARAVQEGVCSAEAADLAMRVGMNYPRGPLQWAEEIGRGYVSRVLHNLQCGGGERYLPANPYFK